MEEKNLEAISSSNLLLILLKVIFASRKEWPQKLFYVLSKRLRENKIKSKHKKKMKNNLNKGYFSLRVGYHQILQNMRVLLFQVYNYLKEQSCKLCNNKYMIASIQKTNTEILAFITVLVFKLLIRKVLFINRKDNESC